MGASGLPPTEGPLTELFFIYRVIYYTENNMIIHCN